MGTSAWDKVRKEVYSSYDHMCGICGATGRLEAHERWEYDDSLLVQSLVGLIALCVLCHRVNHFGLSEIMASQGKLDLEDVINHFMGVNRCSRNQFEKHRLSSFGKWRERSQHQDWKVDLGDYQYLIAKDEGQGYL